MRRYRRRHWRHGPPKRLRTKARRSIRRGWLQRGTRCAPDIWALVVKRARELLA